MKRKSRFQTSADDTGTGGRWYKLPGHGSPEGAWARPCCMFLCLSAVPLFVNFTSPPSPTDQVTSQLRVSLPDLVYVHLDHPPLLAYSAAA